MDNNNQPIQPVNPQPLNQAAPQPQEGVVQQPVQVSVQDSGEKKMILWLVGGLILIGLVVGGIYWYLGRQTVIQPTQQEEAAGKTTPLSFQALNEQLEIELNSLEVQAADNEFQEIDRDLQNL